MGGAMRPPEPQRLYHFTCDHGEAGIRQTGSLLPLNLQVAPERLRPLEEQGLGFLSGLVWLTSEPDPPNLALGLTSFHIVCDRMQHRFSVSDPGQIARCLWWPPLIRDFGPVARELSLNPGAKPGSWWVCRGPVRVDR